MTTIYILLCENYKYYVGKTNNVEFRIGDHLDGLGSEWTRINKPVEMIHIYPNSDAFDEDKHTIRMMSLYGINNVRGGSFTKIILDETDCQTIQKMINSAEDKCHFCGLMGHFISTCPTKNGSQQARQAFAKKQTPLKAPIKQTIIPKPIVKKHCFKCRKWGHLAEECNAKFIYWNLKKVKPVKDWADIDDDQTCFKCGREGHYAQDCYAKSDINGKSIKKSIKKNMYCDDDDSADSDDDDFYYH